MGWVSGKCATTPKCFIYSCKSSWVSDIPLSFVWYLAKVVVFRVSLSQGWSRQELWVSVSAQRWRKPALWFMLTRCIQLIYREGLARQHHQTTASGKLLKLKFNVKAVGSLWSQSLYCDLKKKNLLNDFDSERWDETIYISSNNLCFQSQRSFGIRSEPEVIWDKVRGHLG